MQEPEAKKPKTGGRSGGPLDFRASDGESSDLFQPMAQVLGDPNLELSMLAFIAKEYLERDGSIGKHWKHRNALINRLALVRKGWWHTVAPANGWVRLQSFYRCVIVRKHVTAADMRQWWRIVRVAGDVRNPAIYNTTDAAIQTLAQGCAGLTNVNMFGCRNITDAAIEALAQHCAGLTNVDMSGCSNITDAAIQALKLQFPEIIVRR